MKTFLVTGINSGVGSGLLKVLASNPNNLIIGTVRNANKIKEVESLGYPNLKPLAIEMTDNLATFQKAFELIPKLAPQGIDVIIQNAGIGGDNAISRTLDHDLEDYEKLFQVNTMGSIKVYKTIAPYLHNQTKPFKLIFISSVVSSVSALPIYTNSYGMSKAALNYFAKQVAVEEAINGNVVATMHPGVVESNMTAGRGMFTISPVESAQGILKVIEGLETKDSGKLWTYDGRVINY